MIEEAIKHIEDRIKFSDLRPEIVIKKESAEAVLKELETYKKIAEKLAEKLVEIEDGCKHIPTEICNKYSNGRCKQCIIEWERNEVENDKQS